MRKVALGGVLVLAFILRIPMIEKYPAGFTPDEASFGYDAYSILKTGKDQWGHPFPVVLESFGDFKAPLYAYLALPSVALFGLTKFAIRLPNAVLGTLAVLITYLLTKEILKISKSKNSVEILAAFLLAVSPWHVMLSRGAFEANLTTFFLPLGVLFFLKGLKNSKFLIWASLIFGLNLFTYHSARLVTPLMVIFLVLFFRNEIREKLKRKEAFLSAFIFLTSMVLVLNTFTQGAGKRISDINIFRGALEAQATDRFEAIQGGMPPVIARILHNKYQVAVGRFISTYKQFFGLKFLFKNGAGEATYGMIPGAGVLYWFELPLILGAIILVFKKMLPKVFWTAVFWIIVAPIPTALTTGVGYAANRAAVMMPAVQIFSSFGITFFLDRFKKVPRETVKVFAFGLSLVLTAFILSFVNNYFVRSQDKISQGMLYGNLESSYWLSENTRKYGDVVVSRSLSEPHIYIAFANKWDPKYYQENSKDWQRYKEQNLLFLDQLEEYRLGNYVFKNIDKEDYTNEILEFIVGKPEEFVPGANVVKKFSFTGLRDSVYVVKPQEEIYAKKII